MGEARYATIEQAKIITETYKLHEREPKAIKRALAVAESLRLIAIRIDPGEIIVGSRSRGVKAGVIFPEAGLSWLEREIDTLESRAQDPFHVISEDVDYLRETLLPFWLGNTLEDAIRNNVGSEIQLMARVVKFNQTDHAQGHIIPNAPGWLRRGSSGPLEEVRSQAEHSRGPELVFLRSVEIVLEGARDFIKRYGDLAQSLKGRNEHQSFRQELNEISRICCKLADGAAETFQEAVQSLWFLFVILHHSCPR